MVVRQLRLDEATCPGGSQALSLLCVPPCCAFPAFNNVFCQTEIKQCGWIIDHLQLEDMGKKTHGAFSVVTRSGRYMQAGCDKVQTAKCFL